jgi:hypothetical protein
MDVFQCRLIISQMSSTPADTWNWLLAPLLVIVPVAQVGLANETLMLTTYTTFIALYHIHYGISVVSSYLSLHLTVCLFVSVSGLFAC